MTTGIVLHSLGIKARLGAALVLLAGLAACEDERHLPRNSRHWVALSPEIQSLMSEKAVTAQSPILFRAFKRESELEVWKADATGEYKLLKTYPMCRWSGQLGPKKNEGDRQVPEGFYSITPQLLNPNSSFYLSFNIGYPNAFDRSLGRDGSHIMVHGACSSRGCFSMTDKQMADIYALSREAFAGGQKAIHMQSLPFRFTPENLARYRADENLPFWKNLKEGADIFDLTKREPQVAACSRRYVFNATAADGRALEASSACPTLNRDESLVAALESKSRSDETRIAELVKSGVKPVKSVYQDGDQHASFKHGLHAMSHAVDPVRRATPVPQGVSRVAEVSQPDALAHGPVDVPADEARGLNRTQLLAKAQIVRQQEMAALMPAAEKPPAATPALRPAASGTATATTPAVRPAGAPTPSATALAPQPQPEAGQPAFYQRWMSGLGNLTASALGTSEEKPGAETPGPVPPKRR